MLSRADNLIFVETSLKFVEKIVLLKLRNFFDHLVINITARI